MLRRHNFSKSLSVRNLVSAQSKRQFAAKEQVRESTKIPTAFVLNDGSEMPSIGLGTASHQHEQSMMNALMIEGYKHIDTASIYNNEEVVGQALLESFRYGKRRKDLFVTTKIWHTEYDDVQDALEYSLKKLNLNYVDLYLVHWPMGYYSEPKKPMHVLWREMEALVDKGLTGSIGISNFNAQMIWDLLSYCRIKPVVNQIELNPQNAQTGLVKFCRAKNILPVAYTPIARPGGFQKGDTMCPPDWPDLREHPYLRELAGKYNKTVCQIMLNWGICRGCAVIPKAVSIEHQEENMQIFDFHLTPEEITKIEALDRGIRVCNHFESFEEFDFFA